MKLLGYFFLCSIVFSCSSKTNESTVPKTAEETIKEIEKFEDSLRLNQTNTTAFAHPELGLKYAEKCMAYAVDFPKTKKAPYYLDKAHIILAGIGLHRRSAELGEKLLVDYPFYENRLMVIESVASSYDVLIVPRDKNKVEKYYQLLLKEGKKLSEERKKEIQFRLEHSELTFEELIELQSK